ncbi:serine/threonine protein kinase [Ignicoccus pacificus DSM 13166]|uniref:non-specific serine/threonine protein kinase n=1 Tax=Ignicoccus pacificus DSM 13166 TaxID=940294 RepID=A0A977PKA4_9CREN|nr:serine/threonine protein kinase [Ignicoccus pacificus DSM 13166]
MTEEKKVEEIMTKVEEEVQKPSEEEVQKEEVVEEEEEETLEPLVEEGEEEEEKVKEPIPKELVQRRRFLKRQKDKDLFETVEEVFDMSTQMAVYELMRRGVIGELLGTISAGKEARVFCAKDPEGNDIAVKIYLTSTAEFRKSIRKYIIGDPRFEQIANRGLRRLIYAWARKEFRNLKRMMQAGIRVPKPIAVYKNVLVMEFIGEGCRRAPLLVELAKPKNQLDVEEWTKIFNTVYDYMVKMYQKAKLVHADLNEYNIMYWKEEPVIIDVSQAVPISHPYADEFLRHDIQQIRRFFSSVGVEVPSFAEMYAKITGLE